MVIIHVYRLGTASICLGLKSIYKAEIMFVGIMLTNIIFACLIFCDIIMIAKITMSAHCNKTAYPYIVKVYMPCVRDYLKIVVKNVFFNFYTTLPCSTMRLRNTKNTIIELYNLLIAIS